MSRALLAGAVALAAATIALPGAVAQAQPVPPLVWDGVIVPTKATECTGGDTPTAWRATYRPYISDAVSGINQPSQLVVFSQYQHNATGLRLQTPDDGQFNGNVNKTAIFFVVSRELSDKDNQANAGGGADAPLRTIKLIQDPPTVGKATKYIKITGTIKVANSTAPGLNCATTIRGVFVQRTQPAL